MNEVPVLFYEEGLKKGREVALRDIKKAPPDT